MNNIYKNGVIILDFGSQYTQLIARRVRESNVYSEILAPDSDLNEILNRNPSAIILSGGPSSVYEKDAPQIDKRILDCELPILGICYGLHLLVVEAGGEVFSEGEGEYGPAKINVQLEKGIFRGVSSSDVWMSHGDKVEKIPEKNYNKLREILSTITPEKEAIVEPKAAPFTPRGEKPSFPNISIQFKQIFNTCVPIKMKV